MRMGHFFDGYPWRRQLVFATIASGVVLGALPSYRTFDALIVGCAAAGLIALLWYALRVGDGLAITEDDGSPIHFALALFMSLLALVVLAITFLPLAINDSDPSPHNACLCLQSSGLYATVILAIVIVLIAAAQAIILLELIGFGARVAQGFRGVPARRLREETEEVEETGDN